MKHATTHSATNLGGRVASFGLAVREFLRDPSMVGSAFPASHHMVERLLAPLDWNYIRVFVEYGPGTGRFTEAALARLGSAARLVAVDTSAGFTRNLRRELRDPRLIAVTGSAEDITMILADHGLKGADCILSGLPFSTLEPGEARRIMDASCTVLNSNGSFLAYQMRTAIRPLLTERFGSVRTNFEWRNIPPCHLYHASGLRA